jgi:hypothetical protein
MNKKLMFGFIAVVVLTAVLAIWNVSLSSKSNSLSDVSLIGIDSHADPIEDIGNWWDSKVYDCENDPCTISIDIWIVGMSWDGSYMNCKSGDSYAHCWNCETSCNAG